MAKHRYSDTLAPGEYVKHLDKWRKKRAQSRSPYYFAVKKRIERGDTAIVQGWRGDSQRFSLKSPGHLPKGSSAQSIATYIVYAKYELNNQVLFERAKNPEHTSHDPRRVAPKRERTKRDPSDRAIYYWFDPIGRQPASRHGNAIKAIVKRGQRPSAAVVRSLKKRLDADIQLWPVDRGLGSESFRVQWFDAKRDTFHEGSVEIMN